ncbi:hypothetical protein PMW_161 [Pseudomonas phage phiPMW]|uniref:Uncharacterized protein n=1 Tax=Pseudomonas phage phiPMW TaxID=1815582 RepID=A0A1S5R1K8_9CAUD|nr:hypothetical protein FDG97_gp189 [Pseudomonas phage phiPMW]ANA49286.1 hypothetical protein PMW_161 [Pseudomonas phage phiPMW]
MLKFENLSKETYESKNYDEIKNHRGKVYRTHCTSRDDHDLVVIVTDEASITVLKENNCYDVGTVLTDNHIAEHCSFIEVDATLTIKGDI